MTLSTLFGPIQRLISAASPESPKALVLYQSATGLLFIALILTVSCAIRIVKNQPLDVGSVTALVTALGYLSVLAGWHKQPDPIGAEAPSAPDGRTNLGCAGSSSPVDGGQP